MFKWIRLFPFQMEIFIFCAHVKDYKELEENMKDNKFNYPIFYDDKGECDKLKHLPKHVFYQTFLLDKNNKVLVIGKPKPNNEIWKLYKSIITSAED